MQAQFTCTGTWDMSALESGLREALLKDGCHILEGLLNQPHALGRYTPPTTCHEYRSRRVQSLLGSFELKRGYYQCAEKWSFPMDQLLGLTDSYTPGLAKIMCRAAGTDGSYEEAEETLKIYAGLTVPASQIRRMVQHIGPDIDQWCGQREETRCEQVPTLYISYDGTGVSMRKSETQGRKGKQPDGSSVTREVKLGSVFTSRGVDEAGYPIRDPDNTTYVASFEQAETFGAMIRQEARLRGLGRAQRAAVLGDGAHWIWNLAQINFPQAKQILDFYHACEHLSVLADALLPNDEQRRSELLTLWTQWLEKDKVLSVIDEARKYLPRHGPRRKRALSEIGYFEGNVDRMMYASFRKDGYFIGSGVVEAGCKTVVGKRAKQSGMFWCVPGAQNILDIRCSVMSKTYDIYWKNRRKVQLSTFKLAA